MLFLILYFCSVRFKIIEFDSSTLKKLYLKITIFFWPPTARKYYVIIGPTHPPTPKSLVIIRHHWLDPPTHPRILRNIDTAPNLSK